MTALSVVFAVMAQDEDTLPAKLVDKVSDKLENMVYPDVSYETAQPVLRDLNIEEKLGCIKSIADVNDRLNISERLALAEIETNACIRVKKLQPEP